MKIALVSQEYPPETARGGIGSQTYTKALGLAEFGHEIFVISRSTDSERHETLNDKITVIRIPGLDNMLPEMTESVQWLSHSIVIAAEIDSLLKRVTLDLIDFPEWAAEAYTWLLNRTDWKTVPTVIQLHGPLAMFAHAMNWPELNSSFYKIGSHMEAICVQMADAVYSSSDCSTQWIRKYYDPQKEIIPTIHLGINTELFKPQAVQKYDQPTIIFTGKIVPNKGVEELVNAASNLVKDFPELQLHFIGRGQEKYINQLKENANKLGATDLLNFRGFIDKSSLPEELCRAHIFCAPSYYEGGPGFVYLEAMACGLPVIGCSGSGVNEIIETGENGLLVPPRNSKALEEALRMLLSDTKLASRLALNARKFVLTEADSIHCINKLEAFYYSVLGFAAEKLNTKENQKTRSA